MISRMWSTVRALLLHRRHEREMREEMGLHLDRAAARLQSRGMATGRAYDEARCEFGSLTVLQEEARDARGTRWLVDVAQDLRLTFRRMRRYPTLPLAIIATMGIGLGAATAIYRTFDAALVAALPFVRPERLVHVWEVRRGTTDRGPTSYPMLVDWRARVTSFGALEGYDQTNVTVGQGGTTRVLRGARVTTGFFGLLGVRPKAGRDLRGDDEMVGAPSVVMVSARFANAYFGGAALGHTIAINGMPHTVVGVLPGDFQFALWQDADVILPLIIDEPRLVDRVSRSIHVVGRLRDGVTAGVGGDELAAVTSALALEHPDALVDRTAVVAPIRDALLGSFKPILIILLAAVGCLLVVMGANLALLMLARYLERAPELAMRGALGATRARVFRQLLVESFVPSALGAVLASIVGTLVTRGLIAAIPPSVMIDMPFLADARLNGRAIGAMAGAAVLLSIAFGVGPALVVTNAERRPAAARSTRARGEHRIRHGLVVAQLALTVALLTASALLVTSVRNLTHRELGVRAPAQLLVTRVPLSGHEFREPRMQQRVYEALLHRAGAIPGIQSAAMVDEVPGGGGGITALEPADDSRRLAAGRQVATRMVGGRYFETMGIPIIAGRTFDAHDHSGTVPVAVVSASLARSLGGHGPTIGHRMKLAITGDTPWLVIGIVGDVQTSSLDVAAPPTIYLSHRQHAENRMTLVIRTQEGTEAMATRVRAVVRDVAAGIPSYPATTLDRQLSDSKAVFSRRLPMLLCTAFAGVALLLTLIALYAIHRHEVVSRYREFGIRLALGSSPRAIRTRMFADAMTLGAIGVGAGSTIAIVVARAMRSILFGIGATDWRIYAIISTGVLVSTFLATLGPALRAGWVDPNIALRSE